MIVNVSRIFNRYESATLTFSYREAERETWKSIYDNITRSYSISMKKILFLLLSLALLAVTIVSIIAYKQAPKDAQAFVVNEKEQQRNIAERQIDSLFVHKHTDIFPIYYECKLRFVKGDSYAQTGRLYKDIINKGYTLPKLPTDITSTYRVAHGIIHLNCC